MDQEKLNRINELARLSKQRPLTENEKEEQAKLRKEYVTLVHNNLRGQLQNISVQYPDGTVKPLKSKKEK
ncbi:MAG: DUF896 domain-containing protein [Lachnospiraceae bacterium]|nr:DUF896 domain-containing protein [Lachnospiraceae bacterium]